MTVTCTRRIQFCAGHRLLNHLGECANLHGHNYVALFTAEAGCLDEVGRVMDFAALKIRLGGWIEKYWDHAFIYYQEDDAAKNAVSLFAEQAGATKAFAAPWNPTAEAMANHLLRVVAPKVLRGIDVTICRVQLWETENCYAEAKL